MKDIPRFFFVLGFIIEAHKVMISLQVLGRLAQQCDGLSDGLRKNNGCEELITLSNKDLNTLIFLIKVG